MAVSTMRPSNLIARQQLATALRRGPVSAPQLAQTLGISPRTVLRVVAELGGQCVSAGSAGRRRYALRRALRGLTDPIPVFVVDQQGKVAAGGALDLIAPEGCVFDLTALGWPIDAAARDGWWHGLPYPIYDMRPQGFLGRAFARTEHQSLEVSVDPRDWGDDDVVYVLTRRGSDTPGNLILGEPALRLFQSALTQRSTRFTTAQTAATYAQRADDTVALGVVGSSAAGEFPKFTALRELRGAKTPHVILKFSGAERGAATERWSDLLICEHLALEQLAQIRGLRAAKTRILQAAGRTFLESERFDRHGDHGRSPMVSLDALNGHLLGLALQDWRIQAAALEKRGLIGTATLEAVRRLWWFGQLIANSDMHLGNLSFVPTDGTLTLAPTYDMLPMAYAPLPGGEVPPREWTFEMPLPDEQAAWHDAARGAIAFWRDAADDERISRRFRAIAQANVHALTTSAEKV